MLESAAVVANMVTFLITSFLILALLAIAVYFWQKPASSSAVEALPPSPGRGLFIDDTTDRQATALARTETERQVTAAKRAELIERARGGDKSVLQEAHNNEEADFYGVLLDVLVAGADSDPKLLSLVSFVSRNELRANKKLAERMIDSYKSAPDRNSTAKALHVAALSDDATVYQSAVETALELWHDGRLSGIAPSELRSILEGEFWILSSPTRSSGAGFLLKRALAGARRELEAAQND
jgi:cell division protein FtsI/penicillin-binding protein 2